MIHSRIAGTGSYLPPRIVTNAEFSQRLETSDEWIRERTGIAQRHIADESQASSDLALEASRAAPSPARKLGACAAQRVKYESKNGAPAA